MNDQNQPSPEKAVEPSSTDSTRRAVTQAVDMVRMETTLDSQPIWAPARHADDLSRVYPLKWRGEDASVTVQSSGKYGMLRSFDKLVLTALVHLWNDQSRPETGRVYFLIIDIIRALGRKNDGRLYDQIKDSLHRLRGCMVQYRLSFFDSEHGAWVSLRDKTILTDLLIVEPKKEADDGIQLAMEGLTYAALDLDVVANLVGNFTRPVSLRLLQSLSERGVLFESYVNAVLYRHPVIRKDVFELWQDMGLSTKGIDYGSQLASRMRADLDKIVAGDRSLLGRYAFEKSRTRARSQNLVLYRAKDADLSTPSTKYRTSDSPMERRKIARSAETDKLVEWMKMELHDQSSNDANLRVIAQKMPESLIRKMVYDAFAYYRDGQTKNPAAYFVGIMKREAKERGISLGLPERSQDGKKPTPEPIKTRQESSGGVSSMDELTRSLTERFGTGQQDS